jgi:tetratricopeptide (TPR) repeat protein
MKSIPWPLTVFLVLLLSLSLPAYAGKKDEARKQIETLNQKIKQAGEAGDLQAALEAAEQAYEIAERDLGKKSIETARAMNNMANLYMYADHAADAERIYKNAIIIETKEYGKEHPALADSYYNLAMAYAIQQKYKEASKMMDKAYKIRVEKLGPDHPDSQKIRTALKEIWGEQAKQP